MSGSAAAGSSTPGRPSRQSPPSTVASTLLSSVVSVSVGIDCSAIPCDPASKPVNLENEISRLYALPPAEFTRARKELAKRLRADGENAAAMRVEDLRKPTVAAGLVNRLARAERMNVRALLTAGERLRTAQAKLLRGGSPDGVHKAAADERKALNALLAAARREEPSEAVLRRVEETLRAAAVDDEARELLQQGRFLQERKPVGFGFGLEQPPRRKRSSK